MVQTISFSIEDPGWNVSQVSTKDIHTKGEKRLILKMTDTEAFIMFDMPLSDGEKGDNDYHIPCSFPFCLPIYKGDTLYVVKAKVSKSVPTGWISNGRLPWKRVKLMATHEDDVQEIQSRYTGMSVRKALHQILMHTWRKHHIEKEKECEDENGFVETIDEELAYVHSKGVERFEGDAFVAEETIDDWLEEAEEDEVDGEEDDDLDEEEEEEEEPLDSDDDEGAEMILDEEEIPDEDDED